MSEEKKKRGNPQNLKSWKPGQSGNPNGRPKKAVCITELVRSYLNGTINTKGGIISRGQALAEKLYECAKDGDMTAIKLLMNYIDGLPIQKVEVKKTEDVPEYDLSVLTNEELAEYEKLLIKMNKNAQLTKT